MQKLSSRKRSTIVLLGLPSFGLALTVTVVVTYAPLVIKQFINSTALVGLIIAIEGVVAVFLPVVAGSWSDHLRTPLGGRLPFLIAGLPLAIFSLLLIGLSHSLIAVVIGLIIFFVAYYLSYEPYRAMYPDIVDHSAAGRAQSVQGMWRGIGTGVALSVGGFLAAGTQWLPFAMAATFYLVAIGVFLWVLLKKLGVPSQNHRQPESFRDGYRSAYSLLKNDQSLRNFMIANTLWELCLASLKTFILLYLTVGLGKTKLAAAVIITITSVIMFLATIFAGWLGDRHGKALVARLSAIIFGLGLLVPAFTTNAWAILAILPLSALGGAIVLTLPYAILMPMMPHDQHGKLTGIYSTSRGIGIMLGPLLAGSTISLTKHVLPAKGYSAMWLVCAIAMLLSVVPAGSLETASTEEIEKKLT